MTAATAGRVRTLHENPWLSLREIAAPERGINGYVFSHETRCRGRIVALLPFRWQQATDGAAWPWRREYLVKQEVTPCWGLDPQLSAITGGYEGGDIAEDAVRELLEETGYGIEPADLVPLGTAYASKSSDTVYTLYSADLTGRTPGEAVGDGSRLEAEATSVWLSHEQLLTVQDPQIAVMALRLERA